jgi:hypothetical protein
MDRALCSVYSRPAASDGQWAAARTRFTALDARVSVDNEWTRCNQWRKAKALGRWLLRRRWYVYTATLSRNGEGEEDSEEQYVGGSHGINDTASGRSRQYSGVDNELRNSRQAIQ